MDRAAGHAYDGPNWSAELGLDGLAGEPELRWHPDGTAGRRGGRQRALRAFQAHLEQE